MTVACVCPWLAARASSMGAKCATGEHRDWTNAQQLVHKRVLEVQRTLKSGFVEGLHNNPWSVVKPRAMSQRRAQYQPRLGANSNHNNKTHLQHTRSAKVSSSMLCVCQLVPETPKQEK